MAKYLSQIVLLFLLLTTSTYANDFISATIINTTNTVGESQQTEKQWLEIIRQDNKERIFIENNKSDYFKYTQYKAGEEVVLSKVEDNYIISDYFRQKQISVLFWLFVIVVIFVGRLYGLTSLLGMFISLVVIIKIILPQIFAGSNPIQVVILSSIFLIPITFYLSHGINTKTNLAITGTIISAIITTILAYFFTHFARISGFSSEEASFLDLAKNGTLNIQSLLIAGIIIGSIGILDDVSISQVSVVNEIVKANPKLGYLEIFKRSMSVGRDHVASMVNTLFLVYAGAAMPLMLLFLDSSATINQIINTEMVAEEIIRTLVASIGLILAVPITTLMAANYYSKNKHKIFYNQENSHSHH